MKISARLLIFLIICTLLTKSIQAEDANNIEINQDSAVAIELTKLDVNDTTLELGYKIKNNTDHDVWICDSVSTHSKSERYLAEDAQTLVIRKRLDISPEVVWAAIPIGRYVRLQPAQEYSESLSYALPLRPAFTYIGERANAESAKRLVLEIGFYDQDLPGLIRSIIEVVERLSCAKVELEDYESDIMRHYFKGLLIRGRFGGLEHFDESHPDGSEQFITAYTDQLLGEQILQISVDGLYIPYEDNYPPLENQDANEPSESQDVEQSAVSMELTHFEITDANLELDWKIKNNTDHDVWVCDNIGYIYNNNTFETFLAGDSQTLLIRRRLDVPSGGKIWHVHPVGVYIRLRPGENRPESLVLNLPVQSQFVYATRGIKVTKCAGCINLEIGFYDVDLPALIRTIIQEAEKLGGTTSDVDFAIIKDYFRGLWVLERFGGSLEYFDAQNEDPYGEGRVQFDYPYQSLAGEKILRILIDDVSIPYEGNIPSIPYESDYPRLTSE